MGIIMEQIFKFVCLLVSAVYAVEIKLVIEISRHGIRTPCHKS